MFYKKEINIKLTDNSATFSLLTCYVQNLYRHRAYIEDIGKLGFKVSKLNFSTHNIRFRLVSMASNVSTPPATGFIVIVDPCPTLN